MSSKPAAADPRPWSLALRLSVWYAAAASALVATATGYLYFALTRQFDREDDEFLADKVREVTRALADPAALSREVGGDGRLFVRVVRPGTADVETLGMAARLPAAVFPGAPAVSDAVSLGRPYRLRAVTVDGVTIQAAMDRSHDAELLADFREHVWLVLGASVLAAAAGGYRVARRGVRPIEQVTATAGRIRPSDMDARIDTRGLPAEVRDLADQFNRMLDRLAGAFARLNRFSADIAHELRTPVNNLRGGVEVALGRPRTADDYRDTLGSTLEECDRLTRLIDSLLFLARAENPQAALAAAPADAALEFAAIRDFFEPAAADAGVRIALAVPPGTVIVCDRQLLQRAVGNLVSNAIAHTPAGGTVTLFADPGGRAGVRDTGPGIPPEHLPFVFDRFYRADPARHPAAGRVGLGLAIVKGIAELHGGTAAAANRPGGGAEVTITFPPTPAAG